MNTANIDNARLTKNCASVCLVYIELAKII